MAPQKRHPVPRAKYVPKHRGAPPEPAVKKGLRKSVTYSGVAVAATGLAVTSSLTTRNNAPADPAAATIAAAQAKRPETPADQSLAERADRALADHVDRAQEVSRSDRRTARDNKQVMEQNPGGQVSGTEDLTDQDPRELARRLMPRYGLDPAEFACLNQLWISESDWNHSADNPTSTAYGIPQALTGGTHTDLPDDYVTNPVSQIKWGLAYIRDSYGTACAAWNFKRTRHWY